MRKLFSVAAISDIAAFVATATRDVQMNAFGTWFGSTTSTEAKLSTVEAQLRNCEGWITNLTQYKAQLQQKLDEERQVEADSERMKVIAYLNSLSASERAALLQ